MVRFPYRNVAEYNSLDPAPVMTPQQAVDTLVNTLTAIIPSITRQQ